MSKVREKAWIYMSRVPASGLSSRDNSSVFDSLVGQAPLKPKDKEHPDAPREHYANRQAQMEASGYKMTFCNEFAGETARYAINEYMGALDLKTYVLKGRKPYAWVEISSGKQPKTGDILYFNGEHEHLGVAKGVDGGILTTVEAGQGGSAQKQDLIEWKKVNWPPLSLVGWLDIDLWEYGPEFSDAQPDVEGDWDVVSTDGKFRWIYTFNLDVVTWKDAFNPKENGKGNWRYDKGKLLIDWKSGSTDIWDLQIKFEGTTGVEDMKGEGKINLFATKRQK